MKIIHLFVAMLKGDMNFMNLVHRTGESTEIFGGFPSLGGGFSNIFYVHARSLGKISNLTFAYFSEGW